MTITVSCTEAGYPGSANVPRDYGIVAGVIDGPVV
jgi:hypothetical protein